MKPYYQQDGITIYHADCRDVLEEWEELRTHSFDLLLTDPPYGIGWRPRVNHQDSPWVDNERPTLIAWVNICKFACVWGGNYFTDQLQPSESWLIWQKRPPGFDEDPRTYAQIEMAWSNFGCKPKTMTHVWDGGLRAGDPDNRMFCHPAQKPVEVMRWALLLAPESGSVLDPFMGSGTTLVAAKRLGKQATGIEREERYCEIAAKRLSQGVLSEMFA